MSAPQTSGDPESTDPAAAASTEPGNSEPGNSEPGILEPGNTGPGSSGSGRADGPVPPGTDTTEVAPNSAGIVQPDPPEGGAAADPDSPDPADLAPGFGGDSGTRPESVGGD